MWAWFGYDEPKYTYMPDGKKLLSALAAAATPAPVYVRTHNLLTTGDGTPALKWGSTNAYTEDANGRPRYDWTIVDRIIDTYIEEWMRLVMDWRERERRLTLRLAPGSRVLPPAERRMVVRVAGSVVTKEVVFKGQLVDVRL